MPSQAFVYDLKTAETAVISKSITSFLASSQLIFGFNFGFVKQMNYECKMAAQFISVTMGLIMSGYMAYTCIYEYSFSWAIYALHYILIFFILMFSQYTLYEFLLDLKTVKMKNNIHVDVFTDNIGVITWMYDFFMFLFKFFIGVLYQWEYENGDSFIIRLTTLIPMLALDGIPIVIFLVFYHMYVKLKYLKLGLQNGKTNVFEVQDVYKNIMDLSDKVTFTTDNLMLLEFITDCPKVISTVWNQLILFKNGANWTTQTWNGLYWLHLTTQICLPAVCAEFVHAQGDALRVIAHEKMINENDEKTRSSLVQLASYVNVRPPLPPAWRLLPLGLRLPTTILSICATYLIVVIQFTHLYD